MRVGPFKMISPSVHGVEAVQGLGDVREADGDRVPGAHAEGPQGPGRPLDAADELGVGGLSIVKLVGGLVGILLRHPRHQLIHGGLGVGEVLAGSVGSGLFHRRFLQIFDIISIPRPAPPHNRFLEKRAGRGDYGIIRAKCNGK
jgi:hypothetical protein